jgi:hypothetical protein
MGSDGMTPTKAKDEESKPAGSSAWVKQTWHFVWVMVICWYLQAFISNKDIICMMVCISEIQ